MEQLIRDLNDPRNQSLPGNISHIQRQIQHLQREPSAWQTGLDFLEHPDAILRFYGALTLTVKVNADWYGSVQRATTRTLIPLQDTGYWQGRIISRTSSAEDH